MLSNPSEAKESEANLAVYFDGSCPLCRREIAFYRRQSGSEKIDWIDVSRLERDDVAPGLDRRSAMDRFQVRSADGKIKSGAVAFFEMWSLLPRFAFVARIGKLPVVRQITELGYRGFLVLRPSVQRVVVAMERKR